MAVLCGRAGRLTAKNGGFRPGQGPPGAGQSGAGRPSGSKEDWSKEETDHLFELCERFELKWVVIVDRYQSYPVPLPPRSIEDIKARYYAIVKKLKPQMLPEQMVLDEGSGAPAGFTL